MARASSSTKPVGSLGGVSPSLALQIGHGMPVAPHSHLCGPSHGRSGWLWQTHWQSSQRQQIMRIDPTYDLRTRRFAGRNDGFDIAGQSVQIASFF